MRTWSRHGWAEFRDGDEVLRHSLYKEPCAGPRVQCRVMVSHSLQPAGSHTGLHMGLGSFFPCGAPIQAGAWLPCPLLRWQLMNLTRLLVGSGHPPEEAGPGGQSSCLDWSTAGAEGPHCHMKTWVGGKWPHIAFAGPFVQRMKTGFMPMSRVQEIAPRAGNRTGP